MRIAVKLIDGADGAQIWADRFEDTLEDIFALQDRVALSVAGVIEPAVREADLRRTATRRTRTSVATTSICAPSPSIDQLPPADLGGGLGVARSRHRPDPTMVRLSALLHFVMSSSSPASGRTTRRRRSQARALVSRALKVGSDDPEVLASLVFATDLTAP